MTGLGRAALIVAGLGGAPLLAASSPTAAAVRYPEGALHGFLALRTPEGEMLAAGDLVQDVHGDEVTSRLVFAFRDGSTHDETAVFTQHRVFRLIRYRLVQKGPSFPMPVEVTVEPKHGHAAVRYTDDKGVTKVEDERLDLPPDLANGMVPLLLKQGRPEAPPTMSMVAATPKPRLVKLVASASGQSDLEVAGSTRKATRYTVKVDIGGMAGLLAPLLGKQPPDTQVWILGGESPAFLRADGPLFLGGPIWRIELTSPVWR